MLLVNRAGLIAFLEKAKEKVEGEKQARAKAEAEAQSLSQQSLVSAVQQAIAPLGESIKHLAARVDELEHKRKRKNSGQEKPME